jgi:hypothetical protein
MRFGEREGPPGGAKGGSLGLSRLEDWRTLVLAPRPVFNPKTRRALPVDPHDRMWDRSAALPPRAPALSHPDIESFDFMPPSPLRPAALTLPREGRPGLTCPRRR